MNGGKFITKPLSLWLDLIRAIAALVVVIGHAHQLGMYTGYYPFTMFLQLNAVVVFFVLSGLVIASSAASEGQTLASYAAARLARILPVALPVLLLSHFAAVYCAARGFAPEPLGFDDGSIAPLRTVFAGLFLSESVSTGLSINPPYWSLCYEVWFYVLFGIATFLKGWQRNVWLGIGCLVAGANIVLLLPAWLAGVTLARMKNTAEITPSQARLRITLALAALFTAEMIGPVIGPLFWKVATWTLGHSHYAPSYIALAFCFAYGLTGLRALLGADNTLLEPFAKPIKWTADMSFSLYLLHWPLLTVLRANGVTAGGNALGFVVIVAAVVAVSGGFAALTEHRRKPLRKALERLFSAQSRTAARA